MYSLIPIAARIVLQITKNTCDAQSQTLMMHNHKQQSCRITDQNPSYIEGYLNILYHTNPHHDTDNMKLLHSMLERVLEGDSRNIQPPDLEIDDL